MKELELNKWQEIFEKYLCSNHTDDKSHDLSHFQRVWKIAKNLSNETCDKLIILAACYFHDIVNYPKDNPMRSQSSLHASLKAIQILKLMNFPNEKLEAVSHCIQAHSFSANIEPQTIEAKIVQDADRMESLGAIGLARTFYVAGRMNSMLFDSKDPFAKNRQLNDKLYAIDHFEEKLLKLPMTMKTEVGKIEANKRAQILKIYLEALKLEL